MGNLSCVSCKSSSDKEEGKIGQPLNAESQYTSHPKNEPIRSSDISLPSSDIKALEENEEEHQMSQPHGASSPPASLKADEKLSSDISCQRPDHKVQDDESEPEKPPIASSEELKPAEILSEKRLSAWELYDVLQQHRIKEEDDNNLDEIEKAAKAIVDINVFLASQVIFPAYMKYLEEDHPDLYTQYFCRPSCPTPPEISGEDSDFAIKPSSISRAGKGVVRFSLIDEAIPPSSLDTLRAEAARLARSDEDSEEDEVLWHMDEAEPYSGIDTDLEGADEQVVSAVKVLREIIAKLIEGLLSPGQIEKLVSFARDVIQAIQEESGSDLSSTSLLAEQVVQEAIKQVQVEVSQRIFPTLRLDHIISDTSLLAQQIVKEALDQGKIEAEILMSEKISDTSSTSQMAEHIVGQTLEQAEQEISASVKESRSYASSSSLFAEHVVEQTLEQVKLEIIEEIGKGGKRGVSITSFIAEQVTEDAIRLVELEFLGQPTYSPVLPDDVIETVSSASDLARYIVNHAVKLALAEMQASSEDIGYDRPASAPTGKPVESVSRQLSTTSVGLLPPKSFSSQLVMDVLAQVACQIKKEAEKESNDRVFVQSLVQEALNDAAQDINERFSFENFCDWDNLRPLKKTSSTVTGEFVLKTLRSTICDLENSRDFQDLRSDSALRKFSEALVTDTLEHILQDVTSDGADRRKLVDITATILRSSTQLTKYPSQEVSQSSSLSSTTSHFVEQIMLHSLLGAKSSLTKMDIIKVGAQADVTGLMLELDRRCACTEGRSDTSVLGDMCVRDALETAVYDVYGDYPDVSSDSEAVDILIREALQNAAEDLKFQSSKQLLDSEASLVVRSSMSLAAQSIVTRLMDSVLKDILAGYVRSTSQSSLSSQSLPCGIVTSEHGSDASLLADTLVNGALEASLEATKYSSATAESLSPSSSVCDGLKSRHNKEPGESYTSVIADMLVNDAIKVSLKETMMEKDEQHKKEGSESDTTSASDIALQEAFDDFTNITSTEDRNGKGAAVQVSTGFGDHGTVEEICMSEDTTVYVEDMNRENVTSDDAVNSDDDDITKDLDGTDEFTLQTKDSLKLLRESSTSETHRSCGQEQPASSNESCGYGNDKAESSSHPDANLALKTKSSLELLRERRASVVEATIHSSVEKVVTAGDNMSSSLPSTSKLRRESHVGNIVIDDIVVYDSESSEDEAPIIPTYDGHATSIDHHIVEHALSVISAKHKNDIAQMQFELPVQRASFRDLHHPDLGRLRRFSHDSEEALCEKVTTISCQKLVQEAAMSHQSSSFFASSLENTIQEVLESESESGGESLPEEKVISEEELHSIQDFIEIHSTKKTSEDDIIHKTKTEQDRSSKKVEDKTTILSKMRRASMPHNFLSKQKIVPQSKLKEIDLHGKKTKSLKKETKAVKGTKVIAKDPSTGRARKEISKSFKRVAPTVSGVHTVPRQTKSKESKHLPKNRAVTTHANKIKPVTGKLPLFTSPENQTLTSETMDAVDPVDENLLDKKEKSNTIGKEKKPSVPTDSQPQTPEEELEFDTVSYTHTSKSGTKAVRKKASSKVVPTKEKSPPSSIVVPLGSTESFSSVQSTANKTGSHQSISLRPRPSSGYQKSVSHHSSTTLANAPATSEDVYIPLTPKSSVSNLESEGSIHKHHHGGSCSDACTHSDNSGYGVDEVSPDMKAGHTHHHHPKRDFARSSTGSLPGLHTAVPKAIPPGNCDHCESKPSFNQLEKNGTLSTQPIATTRTTGTTSDNLNKPSVSGKLDIDGRHPGKKKSNGTHCGSRFLSPSTPVELSPKSSVSSLKSFTDAKSGSRLSVLRSRTSVESICSDIQSSQLPAIGASYHHHQHTNHHHGHFFHHDAHVHNRRDPMHTSTGSLPGLSVDTDPLCHGTTTRQAQTMRTAEKRSSPAPPQDPRA